MDVYQNSENLNNLVTVSVFKGSEINFHGLPEKNTRISYFIMDLRWEINVYFEDLKILWKKQSTFFWGKCIELRRRLCWRLKLIFAKKIADRSLVTVTIGISSSVSAWSFASNLEKPSRKLSIWLSKPTEMFSWTVFEWHQLFREGRMTNALFASQHQGLSKMWWEINNFWILIVGYQFVWLGIRRHHPNYHRRKFGNEEIVREGCPNNFG